MLIQRIYIRTRRIPSKCRKTTQHLCRCKTIALRTHDVTNMKFKIQMLLVISEFQPRMLTQRTICTHINNKTRNNNALRVCSPIATGTTGMRTIWWTGYPPNLLQTVCIKTLYVLGFSEGTKTYLYFMSFLHIDMTQVAEILPQVRQ